MAEDPTSPTYPQGQAGAPRGPAGAPREPAVGDAFSQFGQELTDAMRHEVEQLRAELASRARDAAKGTGLLAAAGAAGAVAGAAALSLPLILLRRLLPRGVTALLVAAGAGAASAYLAKRGLEELGEAMPAEADRLKDAAKTAAADAASRVTGAA